MRTLFSQLGLFSIMFAINFTVFATNDVLLTSKSTGQYANKPAIKNVLTQKKQQTRLLQLKGKSRKAIQIKGSHNENYASKQYQSLSFDIYSAHSELITDIDQDGYFQTFSIRFDADIISPQPDLQEIVYANLYISSEHDDWLLYFTTDNFIITGDTEEDVYQVITQLHTGYPTNQYDILIDLIDSNNDELLATYSSDDSNALYALPIESEDYDHEYEVVEVHHGGAIQWLLLFLIVLLSVKFCSNKKQE